MRLSISLKILAGYLVVAVFLVGASLHALRYLNQVADKSQVVLNKSVQATTAMRSLQIALASLEQCEGIYLKAPSPEILNLFQFYQRHFDKALLRLSLAGGQGSRIDDFKAAYERYLSLFYEQVPPMTTGQTADSRGRNAQALGQQMGQLYALLDSMNISAQSSLDEDLFSLREFSVGASTAVLYTSLFGVLCGLAAVFLTALQINGGIRKLREATFMIGQGNFDLNLQVRSRDEMEDLAKCFQSMAQKLQMSEQLCLDASPLTYLPGNIAIERALNDRIKKGIKFALCYIDLDDFKAFNDRYGYARGSDIIKAVADLLHSTRAEAGSESDFIGHIGGDDFVYISDAEAVVPICEHFIREFDALIPSFYSEEDRAQGFIVGADRYGQDRQFSLMTVSIAVVSDARREIYSAVEIARVAAEIKEFVKKQPGSNYLIDRRNRTR